MAGFVLVYCGNVGKPTRPDLNDPAQIPVDEDEETLAAIEEGIADAKAGRTVPAEEVRKLLSKWTIASTTQEGH